MQSIKINKENYSKINQMYDILTELQNKGKYISVQGVSSYGNQR